MNKIDEQIEKLCSNGVELQLLGDICEIKTGKGLTKSDTKENGKYPIISGGVLPLGYYEEYNREAGNVTIARAGNAGYVNYIDTPFWCNDKCFSIIPIKCDSINRKYMYYFLKNKEKDIMSLRNIGTVPTVNTEKVSQIKIAVPPLEIQNEIVYILDKFNTLLALLKAELKARKKQYAYYREKLFANENIEYKTLKDLAINCDYQRQPITSIVREKGEYPYYGASGIIDYVNDYIFDGDYLLISEDGANLISRKTPIAFSITGKNWVNNHAHVLKFDDMYIQKYVELYLNYIKLEQYISRAAQPKLNQENLNKILIPIPDNKTLINIVDILSKFDKLINDLSEGIPAEIEARQKQYEYYRDKLLTFKELESKK